MICTNRSFITILYSFIPWYSIKWWNGAIGNSFFLKIFFRLIWSPLLQSSMMKSAKRMRKGIKIQILILSRKRVDAMIPPSANAQLSPIKTFAGLIL